MADNQKVILGVEVDSQSVSDLAALKKQIDDLKASKKSLDKTTEEGRKQIEATNVQIKALTKEYNNHSKELVNSTTKVGGLKGMWKDFSKAASGALGNVSRGFSTFAKTLLTNPIGITITAIVAVFNKLREAFTQSDSAMTALSRGFAAFQPIIDLVNNALVKVVDTLANVINKAVDFAAKFSPAIKASADFAEQQDKLEETLREHSTLYEQNSTKLATLNQQMRDSTLSLKERNEAAQEYIRILKEQAQLESADKLEQFRQKWQELINTTGRGSEQLKSVYGDLTSLAFEGFNEEKINNIRKAIESSDWADSEKNGMLKMLNEYISIQSTLTSETRVATNTINKAVSEAAEQAAKKIEAANKALAEGAKIAEEYGQEMGKAIEEAEKPVEDLGDSYINLVKAITKSGYTQDSLNTIMQRLNADYKAGKVSLDDYTASMRQLLLLQASLEEEEGEYIPTVEELNAKREKEREEREKGIKKEMDIAIQCAEAASKAISDIYEFASEQQKKQIEDTLNTQLNALDSEREALDAKLQAGYISEEEYNKKIQALDSERNKAQAEATYQTQLLDWKNSMIQVAIQTALGIAKAVAQNPMFGGLPGSAIAAATGAVQLGIIGAKKPVAPKFAKGGIADGGLLVGNSHKQGGILLEAEGGEAIINKKSTKRYAALLSAINQAGGGVAIPSKGNGIFAQGGLVNDGGYGMRSVRSNQVKYPPIYVTVEEINRGQANYAQIIANQNV